MSTPDRLDDAAAGVRLSSSGARLGGGLELGQPEGD
jgi:hypothetical protein